MISHRNNQQQQSRISDVLFEIHRDIAAPLSAAALAKVAAYSEQHFHRVFKQVVGETVNVYIRRARLEHAANQLMFDHNSSVLSIAQKCGFASLSSFSQSFKQLYQTTPAQWRHIDRVKSKSPYLSDAEIAAAYQRVKNYNLPKPELLTLNNQRVAYVRHQGYGRSIRQAWQTLHAWAMSNNIDLTQSRDIGLHHSNPEWVPLNECRYVACLPIDKSLIRRGIVNSLTIPGGLHAAFDLTGKYGELLPLIGKILETWLPTSGFKLQTTPAFVHYRKNHFLAKDEQFDVRLFLPISLV